MHVEPLHPCTCPCSSPCVLGLAGDVVPAKRARTNIPKLAAVFIDEYIARYASLRGDARSGLVAEIKGAMDAADPTWELSLKVIDTRLDNEMKKANKKAKAAVPCAAGAEAATEAPTAADVEPVD